MRFFALAANEAHKYLPFKSVLSNSFDLDTITKKLLNEKKEKEEDIDAEVEQQIQKMVEKMII